MFLIVEELCDCDCDFDVKIDYWSNLINQVVQYNELSVILVEIKKQLVVEIRNFFFFFNLK